MTPLTLVLLAALPAADQKAPAKPAAPAARVTVTAETACLHCTFGEGEHCALCVKLDDKTPVLLEGKAAKPFFAARLDGKVVVAEGTLALSKDKRLVLTCDNVHAWTDKDKGKSPDKGKVRVAGTACCGQCDLGVCDACTLAVGNGTLPVVLDGKLAAGHAEAKDGQTLTAVGKLFRDKRGLLRLQAESVDVKLPAKKDK
jgi:hypothetical protein